MLIWSNTWNHNSIYTSQRITAWPAVVPLLLYGVSLPEKIVCKRLLNSGSTVAPDLRPRSFHLVGLGLAYVWINFLSYDSDTRQSHKSRPLFSSDLLDGFSSWNPVLLRQLHPAGNLFAESKPMIHLVTLICWIWDIFICSRWSHTIPDFVIRAARRKQKGASPL